MKVTSLTKQTVKEIIKNDFSFYHEYCMRENLVGLFEEEFLFCFFELEPRNYKVSEKEKIIKKIMENNDNLFSQIKLSEKALLIHDYKQFPWIYKEANSISFITEKSKHFYMYKDAFGFTLEGDLREVVKETFFYPFLLDYRDISIINYGTNYFYKIDHHLDVYKITYKRQ